MHRTLSSWMWILQVHGQMGRVYQYMNQEKLNLYDEKTLKKNIGTRKTYYIWEEGEGVSQIHEKKIVSVGLFSTLRHPLVTSYVCICSLW